MDGIPHDRHRQLPARRDVRDRQSAARRVTRDIGAGDGGVEVIRPTTPCHRGRCGRDRIGERRIAPLRRLPHVRQLLERVDECGGMFADMSQRDFDQQTLGDALADGGTSDSGLDRAERADDFSGLVNVVRAARVGAEYLGAPGSCRPPVKLVGRKDAHLSDDGLTPVHDKPIGGAPARVKVDL